ncbi:isochorismatase family protein [Mesorhizobium sp. RIZ17]|jgi:hypothetical protein|uniref:isochorismatase family protein n=1 Tax=Mesorhizobium sp. RIZ17 TaxID=3132743 RepID=UPI003DAA0807
MCVLATLLAAIDFGYRTILVEDAIGSTSDEARKYTQAVHDAIFASCRSGFPRRRSWLTGADTVGISGGTCWLQRGCGIVHVSKETVR